MLAKTKQWLSNVFLGEPVKDWGVVFREERIMKVLGRVTEQFELSLHRRGHDLYLCLVFRYRGALLHTTYSYAIPVRDFPAFVTTLQQRYDELLRFAAARQSVPGMTVDRLPWHAQVFIRPLHGVRAVKLLMELRNPDTSLIEYSFYGYITRKKAAKVLIMSDLESSMGESCVVSGDGFQAVLQFLGDYLRQQETGSPD